MSTPFAYKIAQQVIVDQMEQVDTLTKEVSRLEEDLCKRDYLIALLDERVGTLLKENLNLTEIVNKQRGL